MHDLSDAWRVLQDVAKVISEGLTGADGSASLGGWLVIIGFGVMVCLAVVGVVLLIRMQCNCRNSSAGAFVRKNHEFIHGLSQAVDNSWEALGDSDEQEDYRLWRKAFLCAKKRALASKHPLDDFFWPAAALLSGLVLIKADDTSAEEENVALVATYHFLLEALPKRSMRQYAAWIAQTCEADEHCRTDGDLFERFFDDLFKRLGAVVN